LANGHGAIALHKHQIPNPKHQRSTNQQIPNKQTLIDLIVGGWNFPGAWNLELGISGGEAFFLKSFF
jgi:hypothetical protein